MCEMQRWFPPWNHDPDKYAAGRFVDVSCDANEDGVADDPNGGGCSTPAAVKEEIRVMANAIYRRNLENRGRAVKWAGGMQSHPSRDAVDKAGCSNETLEFFYECP